MNPQAFHRQALALCRRFKPLADKVWDENWHEFTYSGWRVGLHFAHRLKLTRTVTSDWISIGIVDPHHLPPFCDHWKWNIHFSGPVAPARFELLRELERRLERLAAHFSHFPAPERTGESPAFTAAQASEAMHDADYGRGDSISERKSP